MSTVANQGVIDSFARYGGRHWRGELGFIQTVFINGVGGYFFILGLAIAVGQTGVGRLLPGYLIYVLTAMQLIWAVVGSYRCVRRYARRDLNGRNRRYVIAAFVLVAVGLVLVIMRDIYYLL